MNKNKNWILNTRPYVFLFSVLCSLLSAVSGCGYTTRSAISDKYRTICIVPFVNKIDITNEVDTGQKFKIFRPMLDTEVTKSVNDKFLFDGNLKPVKEQYANLVLRGELLEFRKDPVRYDDNNEVAEYRMNMVVNLILWDRKEDKLVWEEKGFTGYTNYYPTTSTLPNVAKKSDAQAVTDAIADLSRRVVERTVEEW